MKSQACEPCAKRKVRCDKGEPCSNCKRRKKDSCVYPAETTPAERIKRLENQVRNLGGNPEADARWNRKETENVLPPSKPAARVQGSPQEGKGGDPVVLEEDGQTFYLESYVVFPMRSRR